MANPPACKCASLPKLADVPMGQDEEVFASIEERSRFGDAAWWLWFGECSACKQAWLIAQDERINDVFLMRRLSDSEVLAMSKGVWPPDFLRYEDVLRLGRDRGHNWSFVEGMSSALLDTVVDLVAHRPSITVGELAHLLNVDVEHARDLVAEVKRRRSISN